MKKLLSFASLMVFGLLLSWACSYPPVYGPGGNTPQRTGPTISPTVTATFLATPAYVSQWAVNGSNGMAEGNGSIYVAEAGDGVTQVQLFTNPGGGTAAATWTGYGSTGFLWPDGVAVNPSTGNVYVLDAGTCNGSGCQTTSGSAVYVFTSASTPTAVTSWSSFESSPLNNPSGIALDSAGNVYVSDMDNFQVEEFGPTGTGIGVWNAGGNAYFWPAAVALDGSNNIYVVDAGNWVVWELPSINGTATHWPLALQGDYNTPDYGVAVDSGGNVYVADSYNSLVEVYTNSGELIGEMNGQNGGGATAFVAPDDVLLYNGNIYVGDYENNNIQIFGPDNY